MWFHDLRHTAITELGGRSRPRIDHGHLSRRMLEHYSHIRIDAKRHALDGLDNLRRASDTANGKGKPANDAEIKTIVEVPDDLTSQSRHSLLLQGSPPSGKLLIPLERRDVRVVEGARLESVCRGNSTEGSNPSLSANFLACGSVVVERFLGFEQLADARRSRHESFSQASPRRLNELRQNNPSPT
jgi:hypothetical protein